ncbi:MAG: NAD(P)-dependent oxidoreductase [Candidatus Gottesmanbacteria bacterium]
MKIKILGTGLTGLVGSRIVELLSDHCEFENLSLETGVDITNREQVKKRIVDSPARVILHLAAKTDVDGCENDREKDIKILKNNDFDQQKNIWQKEKTAWWINVEGTKNIVAAAKKSNKKMIYISTDFIFDGTKDFYDENDIPNPVNWYGVTKYEGEKIIRKSGLSFLICRIAFPYRAKFALRKDFLRGILEKLQAGQKLSLVKDEIITPTFIDDIANALDFLINKKATGIYHVVGSSSHTPLEIAYSITRLFSLDKELISETTRDLYFSGRASRPFSLILKNDKLKKLGITMSVFTDGLNKIKSQLLISN